MVCDLLGRPLAAYQSCHRVMTQARVRAVALARVALCAVFVALVYAPERLRSDAAALVVNLAITGLSGFLSVVSYSLASEATRHSREQQAYAGAYMNTAFQCALFSAVLCAEGMTRSLAWL